MKREILGGQISQRSKSQFFSATDLFRIGNSWRNANGMNSINWNQYWQKSSTKDFVEELGKKYGKVKISARGRGKHTWVHPFLFIDAALYLSPKLKLEVYEWIFDHLIRYRNESGDSFKKMTGALYDRTKNKSLFRENIRKLSKIIRNECEVKDWQTANQDQLKKRDRLHENISLLCDVLQDPNQAIKIAIMKSKNV